MPHCSRDGGGCVGLKRKAFQSPGTQPTQGATPLHQGLHFPYSLSVESHPLGGDPEGRSVPALMGHSFKAGSGVGRWAQLSPASPYGHWGMAGCHRDYEPWAASLPSVPLLADLQNGTGNIDDIFLAHMEYSVKDS
jgi:hypothetical protein